MKKFNPDETPIKYLSHGDPVIWIVESEVERHWNNPNHKAIMGLSVSAKGERDVIAAMEDLALLISRQRDYLILRQRPNEDFIDYLQSLGMGQGQILGVRDGLDTSKEICELICSDDQLLARLCLIKNKDQNVKFSFYGTTAWSDRLGAITGIESVSAYVDVTEKVNSKSYSTRLPLSYDRIPAEIVHNNSELEMVCKDHLEQHAVVLKDPMGVSGKGVKIIKDHDELKNYLHYLSRRNLEVRELVVEKFITKEYDINYQFIITKEGRIQYYCYKKALLEGQKHLGHISSPQKDSSLDKILAESAEQIGAHLFQNGYYGVVGVDALVAADGKIYPLLEINARLNNSSFQWCLDQLLKENKSFLVNQMSVNLAKTLSFEEFYADWHERLFNHSVGDGIILLNWGPVSRMKQFPCRTKLFYAIVSGSQQECLELNRRFVHNAAEYFARKGLKIAS